MKIWEKYIGLEFLKFFVFFLFGFYFLYVVIDYAMHMQDFILNKNLTIWKLFQYYVLQFFKRMDIFFPLALLIGSIKVLTRLKNYRELLALQSAGISLKKLLRPLFFIGGCTFVLSLCINEFAIPFSLNTIDKFYDAYLRHSFRGTRSLPLHVIHLEDHSKLIYQRYDYAKEVLFDVIWIRNANDLWKMRYLKLDPEHPQGQWIDHIERKKNGCFEKTQSFSSLIFRDLAWNQDIPRKGYTPFENRSLSELWHIFQKDPLLTFQEKQEVLSQFLFKGMMPWLNLIILLAIVPFCISYAQETNLFILYGMALFAFIAFIAFMDAAVILAESNTLSPYIAIVFPFVALFVIFGWRFGRA